MGVIGTEGTGVVEVFVDPILNIVKFSKIHDKAIFVYFVGRESEFDFPIVTVNERTVTRVIRLSMPEWYVAINLRASKHSIMRSQLKSKFPIVGHHFRNIRGTRVISGGIGNLSQMKSLAAFDAGAAPTAVKLESLVAGPSVFEGNIQFSPELYDIGLGYADEGTIKGYLMPIGETYGGIQRICKLCPTIRVYGMITSMSGISYSNKLGRDGPTGGNGKKDHVAVGNHGGLHVVLGVMPLGNFDLGRC